MKIFSSWLFWFMLAHWVLLLGFLIFSLKYLFKPFKDVKKIYWILLILIFLAGFYLNNSEYWFNFHSDGYVYEEMGRYWLKTGKFVTTCALGNVDDCSFYHNFIILPGFPFLTAITDLIFGYKSIHGPMISGILSSFTVIVLFLLIYLLFKSEFFGLMAAAIYAFIPFGVLDSRSPMPRPISILFIALTLLFFLLFLRYKKLNLAILTVLSLSFAIYIRQENYILLPFLAIFFFIFEYPRVWSAFKAIFSTLVVCSALFFLFQIPALQWFYKVNVFSGMEQAGPFGTSYINIPVLAPAIFRHFLNQYYTGAVYPIIHYYLHITTLFLLGLFLIFIQLFFKKENRKELAFILGLFLLYFFFTSMVAPGWEIINGELQGGDYLRRTLPLNLPYAIIAAFPLYLLIELVKRFRPQIQKIISGAILFLLCLFLIFSSTFLYHFSLFKDVRAKEPSTRDYYLAVPKTPNDCMLVGWYFIIFTSDYFPENHRRAVNIDLIGTQFLDQRSRDLFLEEMRKSPCLILFDDIRYRDLCRGWNDCAPYKFIEKYFNKELLFQEGYLKIFNLTSK